MPKMTSLNVLFCPQHKDTKFTVSEKKCIHMWEAEVLKIKDWLISKQLSKQLAIKHSINRLIVAAWPKVELAFLLMSLVVTH